MSHQPTSPTEVLARDVALRSGHLDGPVEAAASLEALGVTDARAAEMGYRDVFALARAVHADQQVRGPSRTAVQVEERRRELRLDARRPPRTSPGVALSPDSFVVPILVALAANPVLTYSLWANPDPSFERASALTLATVVSLVVAGGFVRVMTAWWDGTAAGSPGVIRGFLVRRLVGGIVATVVTSGLLWSLLLATSLIELKQVPKAALGTAALSLAWLALGFLHAAGRAVWLLVPPLAGVATMFLTRRVMAFRHFPAKIAAELVFAGAALAVGAFLFWARDGARSTDRSRAAAPGDPLESRRSRGPGGGFGRAADRGLPPDRTSWFLFGAAVMGLLLADRIVVMAAPAPGYPYDLLFRRDYEVGLLWAVVATIPAFVVAGIAAGQLRRQTGYLAEQTPITEHPAYARALRREHRRHVEIVIGAAAVGLAVTLPAGVALVRTIPFVEDLATRASVYAFGFATLAYAAAALSLVNATVLFTLGRGRFAAGAATIAAIVGVVVGVVLASWLAPWTAAVGLATGAVVLAVATSVGAGRTLRAADRHLLAAG